MTGARAFTLTVLLIVAAFVTATTIPLARSNAISDAAHGITGNAIPKIDALIGARSELTRLWRLVDREIAGGHSGPTSRTELWRTLGRVREHAARYGALAASPEERDIRGELQTAVDEVALAVHDVVARRDAGDVAGARRLDDLRMHDAVDAAEEVLARAEELDAQRIRAFAQSIERTRGLVSRDAIVLDAASAVLATALLLWVLARARRQKELEIKLADVLRQRADEMEVFAGRVAHDILSPLATTALALRKLSDSPVDETRRLAARGTSGLDKVRATVDGLLEFARAGAPPQEEASTDLVEVARDVVSGFEEQARTENVRLELIAEQPAQEVAVNRGVATSIVSNLVQNALKYIEGGIDRRVSVRVAQSAGRVRVEVEDTGPGIPHDLQSRVFEPYFRAKQPTASGLGLGLATVKRLVEAHGGAVGLSSWPGRGTTFWFEIPARGGAAAG